jgi:type VI protein secretion system component VasF
MNAAGFEGFAKQAPKARKRTRTRVAIGMPWVLVLVQALALIVAGMIGLAMALFV